MTCMGGKRWESKCDMLPIIEKTTKYREESV